MATVKRKQRMGVDTGGTFTDFACLTQGRLVSFKLPSDPANPAHPVLKGLPDHARERTVLTHGTTVGTNAFLQNTMGRTALLATAGFEHLLHIGRQTRRKLFDLFPEKPPAIVPLQHCLPVHERTDADGRVLQQLQEDEVGAYCRGLKEQGIQAVAIVFLHAYKNPANEALAARVCRRHGMRTCASHEIMPEYREYERGVVTVLNAALKPVVSSYVQQLVQQAGVDTLYIMQSSGGSLLPREIVDEPVRTLLSGPCGGLVAARFTARQAGIPQVITLDMGGTSTDVSLIKQAPAMTRRTKLQGLPIYLPMLDIATVGAGGGSIAFLDAAGGLRVGPASAGAFPGPACYGHDLRPTLTDACVVTGRLRPEFFLGGKMTIYPERSREAISRLAHQMGCDAYAAAEGIIDISASAVERALRMVSVQKGEDPRHYTLLPYGGAGGLLACRVAERLHIGRILFPANPGVFSALGMILANYRKEFCRSLLAPATPENLVKIAGALEEMARAAQRHLEHQGFACRNMVIHKQVDMRYLGQSYELTVPYGEGFVSTFHHMHLRRYAYRLTDGDCECVSLRVSALGLTQHAPVLPPVVQGHTQGGSRKVDMFDRGRHTTVTCCARESLAAPAELPAPLLVAADDSTLFIEPGWSARVDGFHNIICTRTQWKP